MTGCPRASDCSPTWSAAVAPILVVALTLAGCSTSSNPGDGATGTTAAAGTTPAGTTLSGCGADTEAAPGTERLTMSSNGLPREYELAIPPSYDPMAPHPLIVDLHGATSTVEQQDLFSNLNAEGTARGYVVLTPQATDAVLSIGDEKVAGPFWNIAPNQSARPEGAQDDIGFLAGLIDSTVAELCIDQARIYLTGFSNGAGMSAALACAMPGRIAAIAPVSGINLAPTCDRLEAVSVIAFHGDADPLVPYAGDSAASVEIGNESVEATVASYAAAVGCDPDPQLSAPYDDIAERTWTGCDPGTAVELFTVLGGGHTWPGMLNDLDPAELAALGSNQALVEAAGVDLAAVAGHMTINLEATHAMLDFFDAHPRP